MITAAHIKRVFPNAKAPLVAAFVDNWDEAEAAGITGTKRTANFFAQIGPETGGLTSVSESLNYSVDGLLKTFSRARISAADAQRLGRKKGERTVPIERQKEIAGLIYGGAWGKKNLGNTMPDHPWKYRGAGGLQTTGFTNFNALGFADNPDALRDPVTAFRTAVREWKKRGCNARADKEDVVGNRKAINGGTDGLADAQEIYPRAKKVFAFLDAEPRAPASKPAPLISRQADPEPDEDETETEAELPPIAPKGDPEEVKQVITNERYTDEHRVSLAQNMLRNLGYTEVGDPNGKIGDFTKTAVRAYRAKKGLPEGDYIDTELMTMLVTDDVPRELPTTRTDATAKDIRAKVPEAWSNFVTKIGAYVSGAFFGLVAFIKGILDNIGGASEWMTPIKEFFSDVPPWAWTVLGLSVAAGLFLAGRVAAHGEQSATAAYKDGSRR